MSPATTIDTIGIASEITRRIGGDSIMALVSLLDRTDRLDALVQALGIMPDGTRRARHKVLVVGASAVSKGRLRSITKKRGFDRDSFEYRLDYDKLDGRSLGALRHSGYTAVIVGPIPHSIRGMGGASDAIEEMRSHPEIYPPVIEARVGHALKITGRSFDRALAELGALLAT